MAATIYYDNVSSRSATLTDGTGASSFSSSDSLTNEERATDGDIAQTIGSYALNDALQFNLGSAIDLDFAAIYFTTATSNDVKVRRGSSSGTYHATANTLADAVVGWNIRTLSSGAYQYRTFVATQGTLDGVSEIFMGNALTLPIAPTANIITEHKFGTEEVKAHGANRYYISKHDNYKILSLSFDHMTAANKTSILAFSNTVTNRKPFIYSEDSTTGPFHWVRLVRPLTFRMVTPDIFSCQMVMRELTS